MLRIFLILSIILTLSSDGLSKETTIEIIGTISDINLITVTSMTNSQQMKQDMVNEIRLKEYPENSYRLNDKALADKNGVLEKGKRVEMICSIKKGYDFLKGEQKYFSIISIKILDKQQSTGKKP